MKVFNTFYTSLEFLSKIIIKISNIVVVLSLTLLVLDLGIGVILRYIFEYVPAWYEDVAKILLAWLTFSGAIIASEKNEHVSIHIFPSSMPKAFRIVNVLF